MTAPRASTLSRRVYRVDVALVAAAVLAAVIGVVMVYTATRGLLVAQGLSPHYFMKRQAIFVVVGLAAMVVFALIDYRHLESVSTVVYLLMVLALLGVLAPGIGKHALGSQRWYPLGPFQFQPSEFAVLALILAVATFCARRNEGLTWRDLLRVLIMAAIPIMLVMIQPDLGTAIIMTITLLVLLAVAGLPGRILVLLVIGLALAVVVALKGGFLHHYQISRLTCFLSPKQCGPQNAYNLTWAKNAIGSGGLLGKGIGHGALTNLGYVPEQQTDFIFTAVGEQLGFVGASCVLGLLGFIAWRVLRAAQLARDPFGRLLCAGFFTFLAFSIFQNAGMTMGIMPITGIPLPFLSYGGSALLVFFIGVGVTVSVYRHRLD
jgi:rod shape determining protein RodA